MKRIHDEKRRKVQFQIDNGAYHLKKPYAAAKAVRVIWVYYPPEEPDGITFPIDDVVYRVVAAEARKIWKFVSNDPAGSCMSNRGP